MALWKRMSVGGRIRFLLEERGMTQVELARKMGLTQASISNWCTDSTRKPSGASLVKLAQVMGANPDWIVSGEGEPFGIVYLWADVERSLISAFRVCSAQERAEVLALLGIRDVAKPRRRAKTRALQGT